MEPNNIKNNTTLYSLKWSTLGHILPQIVSPLITIYIARLLTPEDFGLVAIAMIVISFLEKFLAQGFTTALIQKQGNEKEIYRTADFIFSFNLILSIIFYLIVLFSSSAIAQFFHNPDARSVISILSFSLIIHASGDVQLAMLQKEMDFKSIFFRQIVPIGSQLIITLPLASLGYGVWALVTGKLVSDILAAIILWWKSEWKPRFNFSFKENADIIKFGLYVVFTSLMGWALIQGDNLIVGKFLSTKELGLYKTGYDLDQRIFGILITPILPVFYSKFCSLKRKEDIIKFYKKLKEYIGIIIFPLIAGIILVCPYLEKLILGEKWKGISFIMAMMSIIGISELWALMDPMLRSIGKPNIPAKILFINTAVYIPLWLFFIRFGLKTFLIARVVTALIFFIGFRTYFENKELKINFFQSLKVFYKAFFASIIMFAVGFFFQTFFFKNTYTLISLLLLIAISGITYLLVIWKLSKEQVLIVKDIIIKNRSFRRYNGNKY
jgi:O-antigen/teichoic acid export membrane protein